jgi:plastocyanin domain-containing protein
MKTKYIAVLAFCLALFAGVNAQTHKKPKLQTARVLITENGYSRTSIKLRRGVPARITFVRQIDATCATEVVISAYGIRRTLPLNTPTAVSFTPTRSGEFNFTCGMNMMRGKLLVQ